MKSNLNAPTQTGTTWTAHAAAEDNKWMDITYGNGLFVAVSKDGNHRVMTSPDGISWTARVAAKANDWMVLPMEMVCLLL